MVQENAGVFMVGIVHDFSRRVVFNDPPVPQENDSIRNFSGKTHFMGYHQHCHSFLSQLFHNTEDFTDQLPDSLIQARAPQVPGDGDDALLASADEADHRVIFRRVLDRDFPPV